MFQVAILMAILPMRQRSMASGVAGEEKPIAALARIARHSLRLLGERWPQGETDNAHSKADAEWHGTLKGRGDRSSTATSGEYTWNSRFRRRRHQPGRDGRRGPRRLLLDGAAGDLGKAGFKPEVVRTSVNVHIEN